MRHFFEPKPFYYYLKMIIYINNEAHELNSEKSLLELLHHLAFQLGFGTAIAINNKVIPKDDWQNFFLKNNDRVLIIKASKGG